jgi:small GTP-binding protein
LWDTSGEEEYRAVTNSFYRNAVGAMLVYDITDGESFEALDKWYEDLMEYGGHNCVVMLLGNKSDLKQERMVSKEEAMSFASKRRIPMVDVSAKID